MNDVAIRVEGLGKQYRIGGPQEKHRTLREEIADSALAPWRRMRAIVRREAPPEAAETIWALRDVSFDVQQGDVIGIVGRNGAGKSTALKILSRITDPTEGRAEIHGRVGSLLEVGTGFHPELTGRENIYLNGSILGMRRSEINDKFDEIVDFSEIEKFLDTPVKRYSSGMYVRLAFSVAAHLDPEILLVDEVLSVGDAAFQRKCLGRMSKAAEGGRTVLFVSHNMGAVRNLCTRGLWLDGGRVVCEGTAEAVVDRYLESALSRLDNASISLVDRSDREGNGQVRLTSFVARTHGTAHEQPLRCGEDAEFVIGYQAQTQRPIPALFVSVDVRDSLGQPAVSLGNKYEGTHLMDLPPRGELVCRIPSLPLRPGRYFLSLACRTNNVLSDKVHDAAVLDVGDGDFFGTGAFPPRKNSCVMVAHRWFNRESSQVS